MSVRKQEMREARADYAAGRTQGEREYMPPEQRASAIATDPDLRARWVARLAGKLVSDEERSDAPLRSLVRALRNTSTRTLNVAVLRELEAQVRAEMVRLEALP